MITKKELRGLFNMAPEDWTVRFVGWVDGGLVHFKVNDIEKADGIKNISFDIDWEDIEFNNGQMKSLFIDDVENDTDLLDMWFENEQVGISFADLGHSDKVLVISIDID